MSPLSQTARKLITQLVKESVEAEVKGLVDAAEIVERVEASPHRPLTVSSALAAAANKIRDRAAGLKKGMKL